MVFYSPKSSRSDKAYAGVLKKVEHIKKFGFHVLHFYNGEHVMQRKSNSINWFFILTDKEKIRLQLHSSKYKF